MTEELAGRLAEHTARLLEDVNLRVERYDAVDEDTAFLGYAGHADDARAVLQETARPVVAAFAAALDEEAWPTVDGLVVRAYDPTTPRHRRDGALEWEVSAAVAERFAAASDAASDEAADADTESPSTVVADAMATARIVHADGRVEPLPAEE
ncbi:hypothetical protein [Halomarina oriensis]|uniref:Uncharacterized protein n=1 Tax=Halomarina oriensis TaxID=671145 RepID=A0A6B0GX86_9EURY|nr:hypothetical protein [Halomarina oriensis]MWG36368.1 hypothetical protein [Halomarina oriensis]